MKGDDRKVRRPGRPRRSDHARREDSARDKLERMRGILAEAQKIAHLGSFEYVAATRTTVWSEEEYLIYGLDPAGPSPSYEELLATCIHPEDAGRLHEAFTKAVQSRSVYELEHRIVRPDGSVRWVYDRAQPYFDKRGRLTRYIGATLDITDRKRSEDALLRSREDLDRAQAVGQIGWWRLDTRQNVLTWSDENYRIFGQPKGTPQSYETFLATVHPDDRLRVDAQWQAGLRGEPYDIEHRIVADGQVKWVREKAYLEIDREGRLLGGFGITQDITARKRAEEAQRVSEERYRTLFESMTEGFALHEIVTDDSGRPVDYIFLDVNPAFERLTGLKRADLVGRRVREVLPGTESYWIETYGRVALTGEPAHIENFAAALGRWYDVFSYRPGPRQFAVVFTDISARKRTEEALHQSERRFRQVAESLPQLVWTCEPDGPCDYLSPQWVRYTGKGESEQLGYGWLEQLHPEDRQRAIDQWRDTAAKGENLDIEFRIRRHDGAYRWFRTLAVPFRDEAGRVVKWFGSNTDIDDIKQSGERLRRSEERLKLAQASAGAGTWDWDIPGGRLEWSEELFGLFGLDPRKDAASFEAWTGVIHPEDKKLAEERIEEAIGRRATLDSEYRIVRPSGEIRWIRALGSSLYRDGAPLRMSGICLDVTERKRAEALRQALAEQEKLRLGAALEQASDSIVMVDLDGTIRYVNEAFVSINGIERAEAIGSSYFALLPDGPDEAAVRRRVAAGRPWRGPLTRTARDGRRIELAVTVSPATDPSGAVIGGLISEKDVTRENTLQKQVRQAQKMEALGTLAGGITHDFNNILSSIVINTELALLELDPLDPGRQSLPLVLQAANRGKELVKQIITFSRQRTWEKKPFEIAPIVTEGLKLLRSGLPKDITIQESIDARSGIVLADPSHIHQILVNLCQNAALAMKDRGGRIEVRLEPAEVDEAMASRYPNLALGRHIRLTVSDSGCGMTKDIQERIFEPFFTTRRPGEGSGLGLAVVHGIVRTYGGEITLYSEPGQGSTFHVYLPKHETGGPAESIEVEAGPERGQERILLVEDEKPQRDSIVRSLAHLGYRVTARADGRSALSVFKKDPAAFDLVITDQIMPKMTGLELAGAIVALRPDLPIILCTGFSEKVNGGLVGTEGVRDILMKPYTIREISQAIRRVLSAEKDRA